MCTDGEMLLVLHVELKQSSLGKTAVFCEGKFLDASLEHALVLAFHSTWYTLSIVLLGKGHCVHCGRKAACVPPATKAEFFDKTACFGRGKA